MIEKPRDTEIKPLLIIAVCIAPMAALFWYWRFHLGSWGGSRLGDSAACLLPWDWRQCTAELTAAGADPKAGRAQRIFLAILWVAPIAIAFMAIWIKFFQPHNRVIHSGLTQAGLPGLLRDAAKELKNSKFPKLPGIHIFGGWRLSLERETRHIMIVGAPGSGKTVIFRRIIDAVIARGDKAIIFDEKGDYTRIIASNRGDTGHEFAPMILAPQDERSAVWDIAADLIVSQDAVELAHRIIPESGHPFFTASARAVLAGCTIKLMAEKPGAWTWTDLLNETRRSQEDLLRNMLQYHRGADIFLSADYKQVMSTLGQLETHMRVLDMLSTAWPTYEGRVRFSLREWLVKKTRNRTVLVQHSGRYAELSDGWISALYAVAVSTVTDSNLLGDSDRRRIWFFLDEWGQLPGIKDFERFITLGRSKGVCAVLGLQDDAQIEKNYGEEILNTLTASIGTKIIARVNAGPTADKLQRYFGQIQYVDWRPDFGADGVKKMLPETKHEVALNVADLASLQVTRRGVEVYISGVGPHLYKVEVPFPDRRPDQREGNVPASWTYTFKPNATFANSSDLEAYVKAVMKGNQSPPRGGTAPLKPSGNEELKAEFDAVRSEGTPQNEEGGATTAKSVVTPVDLFRDYRQ